MQVRPARILTYLKKLLKVIDIFGDFIYQNFNDATENDMFLKILKNANVSPVFKKGSRNCKTNYRPVSILPNTSKISERLVYKQMSIF